MNVVYIISFFGFQFEDYWSTVLGLRKSAKEANLFARTFAKSPFLLALYKFSLALVAFILIISLNILGLQEIAENIVMMSDIVEVLVTLNNVLVLKKMGRERHIK